MSSDVLNVRQAAAELGVHENTIRNWEKAGTLKGYRLPGSGFRRFPREEITRMRAEMTQHYAPATVLGEPRQNVSGKPVNGEILE